MARKDIRTCLKIIARRIPRNKVKYQLVNQLSSVMAKPGERLAIKLFIMRWYYLQVEQNPPRVIEALNFLSSNSVLPKHIKICYNQDRWCTYIYYYHEIQLKFN